MESDKEITLDDLDPFRLDEDCDSTEAISLSSEDDYKQKIDFDYYGDGSSVWKPLKQMDDDLDYSFKNRVYDLIERVGFGFVIFVGFLLCSPIIFVSFIILAISNLLDKKKGDL